MAIVFGPQNERGVVVAVNAGAALPSSISISGLRTSNLIVTQVGLSQTANVQFSPTLRNNIFVYAFGERMGNFMLSGIAFHHGCMSPAGASFVGVTDVLDYYIQYGVGSGHEPVTVTLGAGFSIDGFVVGTGFQTMEPDLDLISFNLEFLIPTRRRARR